MISVVVLSRFPDIFAGFRDSVDRDAHTSPKFVLWDGAGDWERQRIASDKFGWAASRCENAFQMARSANHVWQFSSAEGIYTDIVYAGDDTRIIESGTIDRLEAVANSDPTIGVVAARIKSTHPTAVAKEQFSREDAVAFVFVFIKRAVIDAIGYLDERFEGYGVEDIEYCYRARKAGFKVGFANHVTIQHGIEGGKSYGTTFMRLKTAEQMFQEDRENWRRFAEKYGIPNDQGKIWKLIHDAGC